MSRKQKSRYSEDLKKGETLPFGVRDVEGAAVRMVDEISGSARVETWRGTSRGWRPGGDLSAFMDAPEADVSFLRQIGICGTPPDIPHQLRLQAWLQRHLGQ